MIQLFNINNHIVDTSNFSNLLHDNAVIESFHASLKKEMIYLEGILSPQEMKMKLFDYIKRIEDHKGRKLDLNKRQDLFRLANIVEQEINKREGKLNKIQQVLNGYSTYDPKEQKPIYLSDRDKFGV